MVTIPIHSYEECRQAFLARAQQGETLSLLFPARAVGYMGLLYIDAMLLDMAEAYPAVSYQAVIACGDNAALVQEAFRMGFTQVSYNGPAFIATKLQEIAACYSATLIVPVPHI